MNNNLNKSGMALKGYILLVVWLSLSAIVMVVEGQTVESTISIQLNYTGSALTCGESNCDPNLGETFYPYYSCNKDSNWNNGFLYFTDPIPPDSGYVVWNFTATIFGRFDCNGSTDGALFGITLIAGQYMADVMLPSLTGSCSCPNCVIASYFESNDYPNGWEDYSYQGNNSFQFQSMSSSCVSAVLLTLNVGPTDYAVTDVEPKRGPHGGGTIVTVNGEDFLQSNNPYICSFGGQETKATWLNSSALTCVSPISSCSDFPCNVSVEIAQESYGFTYNQVVFTYFKDAIPPNSPSKGLSLLWVYVAVGVCAGSVMLVVAAGYIYAKRNNNKSARFVDEQSRLINSEKFKKYGSLHPIDITEILISQRIGRGSCAEVYMGLWRGTTVAIKKAKVFADDDEEFFTELAQEAEIMSSLRHPNVLQFLGTASSPPELVIVMEFMSRGSLYRIIHDKQIDLPWSRLRQMVLDIARGMNYLHCSDPIIIHRDLKSHNLLVDEHFKVKVCDFGLSTMVKRHLDKFTAMTPVGTPCWTAPEVLRNEPYTERADVFSFGVVMWELVTREDPYHGMPTFQIVIAVGQHNMRPIIPPSTSPSLASLIEQCWSEDPSLRPPFTEIVTRLEKM